MESARRRLTRLEARAATHRPGAADGPAISDLLAAADATDDEVMCVEWLLAHRTDDAPSDDMTASDAARTVWEAAQRGRARLAGLPDPVTDWELPPESLAVIRSSGTLAGPRRRT